MGNSSGKTEKTNVMRILDYAKADYQTYTYQGDGETTGACVARLLNQNPEHVFKTLVTRGASGNHYVFMVPVEEELDLKRAAKCVGEKSISMLKSKELLPLTGYIHGGCSPIGMKKQFVTIIHQTAPEFQTIIFSAGKIGYQVEISYEALSKVIAITTGDIIIQ